MARLIWIRRTLDGGKGFRFGPCLTLVRKISRLMKTQDSARLFYFCRRMCNQQRSDKQAHREGSLLGFLSLTQHFSLLLWVWVHSLS
jgi:hypothetical protein